MPDLNGLPAAPPPFTGPISAAEDLTAVVARRLDGCSECDQFTPGDIIAALLADGQIHEEWGARYHNPDDGDVDTWRETRDEAERTITARYQGVAPWPHPSSLVHRFVIVTAAEVVT